MDGKGEEVFEYLLVVLIVGVVANVLGNFVTPYLDFFTSLAIIGFSTALFIVLKLDLHKKVNGGVKVKKYLAAIPWIVLTLALSLVVASVIYELQYPQTITVPATTSLEAYLDGEIWANNTEISWANQTGTQTKNLTVWNNGNCDVNVTFIVEGLPSGFTETWAENGTVLEPDYWIDGDLTLTVPANATAGTYSWTSYVTGEQP